MFASTRLALAAALALGLTACGHAAPSEGAQESAVAEHAEAKPTTPVKAVEKKKFGGDITETSSTALDALVKAPGRFADKTVRTEGKVSAVCEHKGCWMEIADASGKAHIKMAGHAFSVPRDINGHHAIVQGKVVQPDKDHCTEEAEAQTGSVAKIEIEANAVEIVD